ncbi:hypothetical protein QQZ08_001781 [Neonectria magnoliae]|uniref:Uncharacterized protein n=1 Tax=Neonectria magnoliae TaxID=2732573 RepID=A0ABR1ID81_9HYPO
MNQSEAVKILIEHDADLFSRDDLENFDFIMYAAVRDHWDLGRGVFLLMIQTMIQRADWIIGRKSSPSYL